MTLLEFAEKSSPVPLMDWQKIFIVRYEEAKQSGKELIFYSGRVTGRKMTANIINQLYRNEMKDVYCMGTKKNGIPCRRYLGKVEGRAELLCPICKTINIVSSNVSKAK